MSDLTDPNLLTMLQGKTFRVVFTMKTSGATPVPVSLAGYGAMFTIYTRAGGSIVLQVLDTTTVDPDAGSFPWPANPPTPGTFPSGDAPVQVEPSGLTGQVWVRLGADITSTISKTGAYDAVIYLKSDPTEVQPLASGPLLVLPFGADSSESSQFA
jgi:hypothetical protein